MEQKRIGSVEPIGGITPWHFIAGAALKYANDKSFEDDLIRYVEETIIKIKNKKNE